jgi:uncharacterized protein YfaS (alpha-2-macroglobulin family)
MRKKYFLLSVTLIVILLSLCAGCKKNKDKKTASFVSRKPPAGELLVSFVSPRDQTATPQETETIFVIFDHPMVPLESLSDKPYPSLIQLEPQVPGIFRWLNPKTLSFIPKNRLPYSTEFKAVIQAGTSSFEGYSLKNDFSWKFRTVLPRLEKHFPYNKQKWLSLDTQVLMTFNIPISNKKADNFISFLKIDKLNQETSLDFSIKSPSEELLKENRIKSTPENVLLLTPKNKLEPETKYFVEIKSGLQGKEGDLGTSKSKIFEFETFSKFEFKELDVKKPHNPFDALLIKFSNPVIYKELIKNISFNPDITIPEYYSEWNQDNSSLWLTLPLQPETNYTFGINSGLQDKFGNKLGKEIEKSFITAPYPPSVDITTGHALLESYGDLKYPIYAINSREVFMQSALIEKEDIIPLLMTKNLFWSKTLIKRKGFFLLEKNLQLNRSRNQREMFPIELKKVISEKTGIIFLQLNTNSKNKWRRYPKTLLQVTNLGITAKYSQEKNVIWVTTLKDGIPVSGANIEIRDDSNKVCWKGQTDEQGKVETPGWKYFDLKKTNKWSKPRQWILVEKGKDIAFTSSEWETGIYPYRFGIQYDWNPEPEIFRGYIFTERGIYRAGENVHLKGIFRKQIKGDWQLPVQKNILLEIQDPYNKKLYSKTTTLDDYGSFSLDFKTDPKASLGSYRVTASIPYIGENNKRKSVYSSFRVEAFRPAEFKVFLRSHREDYIFGDEYQAELRANYLFGGSMGSQKVNWHLRLNPASYSPPGYKKYLFGNQMSHRETYNREESRLISSGEAALDKEGKYIINAKLIPEKESNSVLATIEGTVQGPSRKTVSSRIQALVHRGEYYIGIKPETRFLSKGEELSCSYISVDPDGQIVSGEKLNFTLLRREWQSVRKAEIGGRFRWISEKKDIEIKTQTLKTKKIPAKITFLPEKAGYYILKAEGKDKRGNVITTLIYFYVTGSDYIPWQRQDDNIIELIADRESYRPGETARILVKSPYERAHALITVERESVVESHVQEIIGGSRQIKVPVRSEYIPNVFVSIVLVQGRISIENKDRNQDLGKPSFKMGYVKLNIDPAEKNLAIDIQKENKIYKPGEKVSLKFKVTNDSGSVSQASLSVAVVDIGVLNLIGFKTPDPFSIFYSHKPLSVATSETRHHVMGQRSYGEKGDEASGGGGVSKTGAPFSLSEIELRGDFKFTAFWNSAFTTDKNGNATIQFILPDNLTTFRVMAVAQTKDSCFGRSATTFKVSKPILMLPSLPRFARIGDEFKGGVVLYNHSAEAGKVTLNCQADGILLLDKKAVRDFSLKPGESREQLFSFKAEQAGSADLSFRVHMGKNSDGLEIKFPVMLPRPTETTALYNETSESIEEKIKVPKNVYPAYSSISFWASSTALTGLKGSLDYLKNYPYLCLEQRISSILPFLVAGDIILDFKLSNIDKKDIQKYVIKTLEEVYTYQQDNGGFSLWPDSSYVSPFNSCYTAFALLKAQQAGYEVDPLKLSRLSLYLVNLVHGKTKRSSSPYNERIWNTTKAYALYCLALMDRAEHSYAEKLYSERQHLTLFGKTLLFKALFHGKGSLSTQTTLLQELTNKLKVSPTTAHFEADNKTDDCWIYTSNIRATAFILQALIETGSNNKLIPAITRWLVERRNAGKWLSTQENVFSFYALNDYYRNYENIEADFKLTVSIAGKSFLEEMFTRKKHEIIQAKTCLKDFDPGKTIPLKIKKKGTGKLYYETRLTYAPNRPHNSRDEGFTIYKTLSSLDGKPLDSIQAGQVLVITLQLIIPQERLFVVINDPLPAGFEAVNPNFLIESREKQGELALLKSREDGSRWRGFNHIEIHDNKILLFADSLSAGIHTHHYLAHALSPGTYQLPGTKIEQMYAPEVFGRSNESVIVILK